MNESRIRFGLATNALRAVDELLRTDLVQQVPEHLLRQAWPVIRVVDQRVMTKWMFGNR